MDTIQQPCRFRTLRMADCKHQTNRVLDELSQSLVKQVADNQFNVYNRHELVVGGGYHQVSALVNYRKIGPDQHTNWNVPPYLNNPDYVLGIFKVKLNGNMMGTITVNVGHVQGSPMNVDEMISTKIINRLMQ